MGRIVAFLLVLIVAALAARVLFVDARELDEADPRRELQAQALPRGMPESRAEPAPAGAQVPGKITIVDPDPDLDQVAEPADCPGSPEQPLEPKPEAPAPH